MLDRTRNFNDLNKLKEFLSINKLNIIFRSSATSTVTPFDKLPNEIVIIDISTLLKKLKISEEGHLIVEGAVSWQEARAFVNEFNLDIMTAPSDDTALVLAGVATSATGERAFGHGTLRDQIIKIDYMDNKGEAKQLSNGHKIIEHALFKKYKKELEIYQELYKNFKISKNAPFPRLENETDLMIGTEGQLGVITSCEIRLTQLIKKQYIFIEIPKFENNFEPHLEIYRKVQEFRASITACEFIDSNSNIDDVNLDRIYFEIKSDQFEDLYQNFFMKLELISLDQVYEISTLKYQALRESVPRATNEYISRNKLIKKGTDAQAMDEESFRDLFIEYVQFSKENIDYQLFGHFGDGHLHFNFLPKKEEMNHCDQLLEEFYDRISKKRISPFAEHGIGILKKKYLKYFLKREHFEVYKILIKEMDSLNLFFPLGFLNGDHNS